MTISHGLIPKCRPTCPLHRLEMVHVPMPLPKFVHVVSDTAKGMKWRQSRKVWKCPLKSCSKYGPDVEMDAIPDLVSETRAKTKNGWLSNIAKGWE